MSKKDFTPMADFESDHSVLTLLKEEMEVAIDPAGFAGLSFDVRQVMGMYVVRIQREMLGERIQELVPVDFTFKTPASWWDHFKQDNFPAWLLRKYPVKYIFRKEVKTVKFDRSFVFPNAYREGHYALGKYNVRDFSRIL